MIYSEFKENKRNFGGKNNNSLFKRLIISLMSIFIPKANPDFEDLIDLVDKWLVEYDDLEKYVNREIGIDSNGIVIMKMPYKMNYGYWIDTEFDLEYLENTFTCKEIDAETFENNWIKLDNL